MTIDGDQRRRLAAVVGQGRDHRGQARRRGVPGAPADLERQGPAGRRDRRARDPGVVVGLGEDVRLVPAERLRRVHRRVGVADQRVGPEQPAAAAGDPDGDRDADLLAGLDREPLAGDEVAELLGEDRALLDVRLGQQEHELLAAVAADGVRASEVVLDRLGDAAQDDVAGGVAVRVVDRLEVVDVDEGDRQRPLVAVRPLDLGEERGQERARGCSRR